ncbi:hypothetical protein [Jiella pelagia]|uniref:Uncharacterized protein n=1 Tax=Jiella pelagia TaxID=2986949 RepID=A0ABY7C0L6_9HYPH|nr:hypothetical protein [Jiella pelagia]WAP69311.1 hypothetical protein OH818_03150 [Jiella pelagia]
MRSSIANGGRRRPSLVRDSVETFHSQAEDEKTRQRLDDARQRVTAAAKRIEEEYRPLANQVGALLGEMADANRCLRRAEAAAIGRGVRDRGVSQAHRDLVATARLPSLKSSAPIYGMGRSIAAGFEHHPEHIPNEGAGSDAPGKADERPAAPAGEDGRSRSTSPASCQSNKEAA